jgi:hypothetical protein
LLEGQQTQPVLVTASVAVSLVYALPLIRVGWHLWRDSGA